MTKSDDWAAAQARRIGATVFKLRGRRSGVWLSDETAKAGHRISRTSISELEIGKRKSVSTAELVVLAVALKVPPVRLLYPDLPDGVVEFVPGKEVTSFEAVQWFSGEEGYVRTIAEREIDVMDFQEARRGVRLVELARQRQTLEEQVIVYSKMADKARQSNDDAGVDRGLALVETSKKMLEIVKDELRLIDGAVVADGG